MTTGTTADHAQLCADPTDQHPICTGPETHIHGVTTWTVSDRNGHRLYLDAPGLQLEHDALNEVIDRLRAEHARLVHAS